MDRRSPVRETVSSDLNKLHDTTEEHGRTQQKRLLGKLYGMNYIEAVCNGNANRTSASGSFSHILKHQVV